MMRAFSKVALAATLLSSYVGAITVQQEVWNIPDGNQKDLFNSFTQGVTTFLSWNGWEGSQFINGNDTLCDLWAGSWDATVTGTDTYLITSEIFPSSL